MMQRMRVHHDVTVAAVVVIVAILVMIVMVMMCSSGIVVICFSIWSSSFSRGRRGITTEMRNAQVHTGLTWPLFRTLLMRRPAICTSNTNSLLPLRC